jgi:hypothetical protein
MFRLALIQFIHAIENGKGSNSGGRDCCWKAVTTNTSLDEGIVYLFACRSQTLALHVAYQDGGTRGSSFWGGLAKSMTYLSVLY